ncbi:hypothetical protein CKO16_06445 [Rhodoblastus acidophilus]|nr:hypothetical protein CKO16_06445 [Rhodoblastus acidophilus]
MNKPYEKQMVLLRNAESRTRGLRRFPADADGAVALEFALLAMPLLGLMLVILEEGLDFYMRAQMDRAAQKIARQIATGAIQNTGFNNAAMTQQSFIANTVCGALPNLVNCSKVFVSASSFMQTASPTPYYSYVNGDHTGVTAPAVDNTKNPFCLGNGGSYMMLQVSYLAPLITSFLSQGPIVTYQGAKYRQMTSTVAFRNEPFPTPTYPGC